MARAMGGFVVSGGRPAGASGKSRNIAQCAQYSTKSQLDTMGIVIRMPS